ncbi:hypothetical protein E2P81_ATG02947 [Venturia nashicola]|nr:hypothetical protein E2P81_ATG02947 [Venturia nashicola]
MASSEETMWGFEKVELPSAMEPILYTNSWPNPTPTDTNRSHPIVRTQDARDERDDNKSSSSNISGRPVLDQRLAKSFKIVHRRRDKLVERRVKVVHQRREHEYQRKAVQASNQRVVDATDVFLKRFAIEVYSSPEYLAIVGALKESTDRARILESKETKLQESTENVNLKEAELFSKEKKVQHQQDLMSRQARRESGHITKPERLSHEGFYGKLASILEELERANKEAFQLKLACERQGIVLEDEVDTHRDQDG